MTSEQAKKESTYCMILALLLCLKKKKSSKKKWPKNYTSAQKFSDFFLIF
jgi:hypothetical protein